MAETLAYGYSSDSILQELSNEYQHDRVKMFFIIFCFFVHCTKVTSASEGLTSTQYDPKYQYQMGKFYCIEKKLIINH